MACRRTALLLIGVVVVPLRLLAVPGFVAPVSSSQRDSPVSRSRTTLLRPRSCSVSAVRATEAKDEAGFMTFMKAEPETDLSPAEYALALKSEIEVQRRKSYIRGESTLVKDARRQLRRNGIKDPSGADADEEDRRISITVVGLQDALRRTEVNIQWAGGHPGTKVGYIVEKKRYSEANFRELANYEIPENHYLVVKQYAGHTYFFREDIADPGAYTYRVLCRYDSGEVQVVDQQDITVPSDVGLSLGLAIPGIALISAILTVVLYYQ